MQVLISSHMPGGTAGDGKRTPVKDKGYRDPERYRLHAEVCRVLTDPKRLDEIEPVASGAR
jgi:hypothetical protein